MLAPRAEGGGLAILLAATGLAFAALVSVFWVGFLGSDDSLYWEGAGGWLAHFPFLGTTHWALRHTLVIPMAIARAVLGDGLPALLLPSLLYSIGVLVVTAIWVRHAAGLPAAAVAMALVVTNPQFILFASVANIDIVEVFFVLVAFALIHTAMERSAGPSPRRTWSLLLLAGVASGLAMLSRETAAFAVLAIGLLFLAGYGMHRAAYFVIGLGFAAVVGFEFLSLWHMSGEMFFRASLSLHHDNTINRWLDHRISIPFLHPAIDPVTMVLLDHNFGLLGWLGVPLVGWLMWRSALDAPARRLAVLATTLAVTWTVCCAGLWSLLPLIPRYFLLPALLVSILSGIALARLWVTGRRSIAAILGALLIGANLFSISIDNRNYMYGEHVLVDIAAREPGPVHTDSRTLRRATLLLEWKGIAAHVTDSPPGPGDLFYFNPARDDTRPAGDWMVVEQHGLSPTAGQWLAARLLPAKTLSPAVFRALGRGHPDVTLYRIP